MSKQLRIWLFVLLSTLLTSTTLPAEGVITMTTSKSVGETIELGISAKGNISIDGALETGKTNRYGFKYYTIKSQRITIQGDVTTLYCYKNQLTSLDVSSCIALTNLYCDENQLTGLDVSQNTALTKLGCGSNRLTSLNVSNCTALTELWCHHNQLTSLDLSKNTALTMLHCGNNELTSLDVSQNAALTKLRCGNNQLTSLNVSSCTALTKLWCLYNQLTSLDVSKNTALTELFCYDNQLTSLDVSQNTALTKLECEGNQLTNLDVSVCTALTELGCYNNQLTSLDVSGCTALTELGCYNNQLTSLNLSNCRGLETLKSYGNKFDNGAIHQLISSLPNRKGIGVGKFYVIDSDNNNTCYQYDVDLAKKKFWLLYHKAGALYLGEPNPTFALTYEPTISGGSINIKGADDLQHVVYGTELTIEATPATGYELTVLTANGTDILPTRKVVVTEATEIKATFVKKTFVVTLDKVGEGELSTTGTDNLNKVPYGTELTIIATAAEGYELKSIVVDGVNITATKKLVIKNNVTVKATFVKKTFKVTLTKEGEGTITATGASNLNAVAYGTELTIVATPAAGYELQSLVIDGVVNITATKKVVVTDNVTIKATFVDHTGVETTVTQQVQLYPNPATDHLVVEGVAPASEVTLHSMTGERLYAGRADDRGVLQIDLTPYADGVYLVCVAGETYRVVVRR